MKGRKIAALVIILYVLFLAACSLSWLSQLSFRDVAASLTHTVVLEEGSFPMDSAELTTVLHEGETAKLAGFTALRRADFRGSACIEEIYTWAQAHPEVEVLYDVPLPNGAKAENLAQALDFSGVTHANLAAYTACLTYLPEITAVDLGSSDDGTDPLTPEDLEALSAQYPDKTFSYSVRLGGESYALTESRLDLTALESADVPQTAAYLPCMKNLREVELGDAQRSSLSWEEIAALTAAAPQAEFSYSFTLYGKPFRLTDEIIDLSKTQIDDGGEAVVQALPALYRCKTLDMDDGGVVVGLSDAQMQHIREQFPAVDVVWRIRFGQFYSVRTDTERILASKPTVGGVVDDAEAQKLRYCTHVKYLDLGHNEVLTDLSFVSSMPELEVLIVAMNPIADLSPLKDCPKLEYLEVFTTYVSDLSPLKDASALRHLNISNCPNLTDISPLYALTELERLWIGTETPIPAEQVDKMRAAAPNCKVSTVSSDEQGDAWRYTHYDENLCKYYWVPRYEKLAGQLGYFTPYKSYSFYWLDPKCEVAAPAEFAGEFYLD